MYSTRRPALPTALTLATLAALLVGLAATLPAPAQLRQEQVQPQPAAPRPQAPRDAAPDAPAQPAQPGDARTDDADRAIAQEEAKVDPSYVEPVLAERLAELAQANLRQKTVTAPMWRQSGALLEAATRLNPREPRLARLLVEARLKMEDAEGAIKALGLYRRIDPADRVAQIQLIDLYADRIETADAKLEYLRDLLDRTTLPSEVRSHVAARCVPLLMERSQEQAMAVLDEALRLNPVSPEALRLRYELTGADAPAPQRCAVLLSLLRSNPAQPDVVSELAEVLASVGLAKDSVEWYTVALRLYPRLGRLYPEGFVSDLGAQLMFTNQNEGLETLLGSYLKAKPDDADAWFIRLVKEKAAGDKGNAAVMDEARSALTGRWYNLALRMAGREPQQPQPAVPADPAAPAPGTPGTPGAPGTPDAAAPLGASRPATDFGAPPPAAAPAGGQGGAGAGNTQPPADPAEAVRRLKAGEAEELAGQFVSVASDLAWFELYFAEKPEGATQWVAALKELLSADNVTVTRLEGWLDLLQGRPDQASEKLASVADRDPLAAMGLIRLAGKDANSQAYADDLATKLRNNYPTGLVAAMVWSGMKSQGRDPKLVERPEAADVKAEIAKFPNDWLEILNQPTAYYKVNAEVLKVAHKYGEPLLGRVTLTNITDYPLTIGENGIIRPDLWFDARLGGLTNLPFPGVAYDRIARAVVLPARGTVSQIVRIDQGPLRQTLWSNPSVSTQVLASVMTNPVSTANGVGPGPAGHRQPFNKALARGGFPVSQSAARKRALAAVDSGTPGERLRNLELMATYIRTLATTKDLDPAMKTAGNEFTDALNRTQADKVSVVAAWATFIGCHLVPAERRGGFVDKLVGDANWPARLLGLMAAGGLPIEQHLALADRLAQQDPEPLVKEYAAATVEHVRSLPARPPAGAPDAGAPAPGEAGQPDDPAAAPIPSGLTVPSETNNAKGGGQ